MRFTDDLKPVDSEIIQFRLKNQRCVIKYKYIIVTKKNKKKQILVICN